MSGALDPDAEQSAECGDDRVDAAVARLADLDELPVADHVPRYDEMHGALQDVLTTIEQA